MHMFTLLVGEFNILCSSYLTVNILSKLVLLWYQYSLQSCDLLVVCSPRTEMLGCENDADFKVKVYCLRQAFDVSSYSFCFILPL